MRVAKLPTKHTRAWYVHAHYRQHALVGVELKSLETGRELFGDDDLEQKLIDTTRASACVNACELLNSDEPMREIEALQRDRARLMDILASKGYARRDARPSMVLHPGSDQEDETSMEVRADDGRIQIGPLDC